MITKIFIQPLANLDCELSVIPLGKKLLSLTIHLSKFSDEETMTF